METRTVEQVNQWESRPFSGGLAGLRELAEAEFSGAVRAADTWAFVLNGRVIGVFEGELEDFEGRDGTAYRAPDQALALLFTMQELGGQTQAKYYTNDTPLSEVHETLSSANFSGYVELSENVLSGDYYVAYYGGRSMSAAFVGESERLLTGEEAFERADDEVGIYEVRKVDLDVIDLSEVVDEPEPEPEPAIEPESNPESAVEPEPEPTTEPDPEPEPDESPERADEPDEESPETATQEPETDSPEADPRKSDDREPAPREPDAPDADETAAQREADAPDGRETADRAFSPAEDESVGSASGGSEVTTADSGGASEATAADPGGASQEEVQHTEDVFNEEQQWRQARAIPALDPGRSSDRSAGSQKSRRRSKSASKGRSATESGSNETKSKSSKTESKSSKTERNADGASVEEFEQALQQSKQEIERLSERLSKTESEQQELLAEREELRSEVQRLESELETATADDGGDEATAGQRLPAAEALEGTNLFVRYGSKSQSTLEDAREGADREEVNANLSLEHHTRFDADEVVVDGQEFEAFLQESIQYRFVEWLTENLLYEIRDTGHVGQLRELFDAIPKFDRAELSGNATIRKTEDGEEIRTQRTFDVIVRDRMGNPLVVANLNDARDPATGDMMADLVAAANDVGETSESLSAAVFVTASFFEPAALETAAEATGGGLLSREKKESYVKLTRKRGYHLCLVETRGRQFHVNVPEL